MNVEAVQLKATVPGDKIIFSHTPTWLQEALEDSVLLPISGHCVDGSDWVYISMSATGEICRTDDWVVRGSDESLYFAKTAEILTQYESVGKSTIEYIKKA